jgi:hypothetical protein
MIDVLSYAISKPSLKRGEQMLSRALLACEPEIENVE